MPGRGGRLAVMLGCVTLVWMGMAGSRPAPAEASRPEDPSVVRASINQLMPLLGSELGQVWESLNIIAGRPPCTPSPSCLFAGPAGSYDRAAARCAKVEPSWRQDPTFLEARDGPALDTLLKVCADLADAGRDLGVPGDDPGPEWVALANRLVTTLEKSLPPAPPATGNAGLGPNRGTSRLLAPFGLASVGLTFIAAAAGLALLPHRHPRGGA